MVNTSDLPPQVLLQTGRSTAVFFYSPTVEEKYFHCDLKSEEMNPQLFYGIMLPNARESIEINTNDIFSFLEDR